MREAVTRFIAASLAAFFVLLSATILIAGHIARNQALHDARDQGASVANRLVAPLIDEDVRRQVPGASDELDIVMQHRMEDGSLRHVKLWDDSGRVIWSDEHRLVGHRYPLKGDVAELFGTTKATAEVSDLSREENVGERPEGELLEVYVGAYDADGKPVVFEAYLPTKTVDDYAHAILMGFLPLSVGVLTLFLVAVVPLAVWLGRRVHRAQLAESRATRHALLASDLERRRIAEELHDGVVQDLAGVGYALPAAQHEIHPGGDLDGARSTVERASALLQRDLARLRALMTDIYPPDLRGPGLASALEDLTVKVEAEAGVSVRLDIAPDLELTADAGRLTFRVVREALRNVAKHADAEHALVEVGRDPQHVLVRVVDDGRGLGPDGTAESPEGHLGLTLLRDAVRDAGGVIEIASHAPSGTSLVARFPADLSAAYGS